MKRLWNKFGDWITPRPKPEVRFVEREVSRLTSVEWRADRHFVATAAGVLRDPNLKLMIDCVMASAPCHEVLPLDASPQARIAQQCRQEGYTLALATLQSLGKEARLADRLESTFEDTDTPVQRSA